MMMWEMYRQLFETSMKVPGPTNDLTFLYLGFQGDFPLFKNQPTHPEIVLYIYCSLTLNTLRIPASTFTILTPLKSNAPHFSC